MQPLIGWRSASIALVGLVVNLLVVAPAWGQESSEIDLHWGVSAGVASSSFQGAPGALAGTGQKGEQRLPVRFAGRRTGATLGIHLQSALTDRIGLRTGLRYAQKGGVVERDRLGPADGPESETARYQLGILSMPVLGTYDFLSRTSLLRPTLVVGPAVQRVLRSTVESKVTARLGGSDPYRLSYSPDSVRPMGVTLIVGGDLSHTLPNGQEVVLTGRYAHGVTGLVDGPGARGVQMGTLTLGIQYVFPL